MNLTKFFLFFFVVVQLAAVLTAPPGHAFTLEECVALALANNLDLRKQQLNLEFAREDMTEQRARNFGTLHLISSYTHYNLPRTLAPLTPASKATKPAAVPTTEDLFVTGIVYELPLFTGFAQTRTVEIASLQKEMIAAGLRLSREQLIYNVKSLYINILSLASREKAQTAYVQALQRLHEDIIREVQLGKKARIDQLQAGADLKNRRAEQARIAANIKILRGTLASLLNVEQLPAFQDIVQPADSILPVDAPSVEQLAGLERLRAARLEVEKNSKLALKAQAVLYPQVALNSSYGQNFGPNDGSHQQAGDWENQEVWQAGLNLQWNIFDFGGNRAKVQKARTVERQSRYEQAKTELELRRALQEADTKINTAVTDYDSAREELAMRRESEAIEQVRYEQGVADINDILSAKARTQQALSRLIGAGYSYKTTRFYLDYLLENGETGLAGPSLATFGARR